MTVLFNQVGKRIYLVGDIQAGAGSPDAGSVGARRAAGIAAARGGDAGRFRVGVRDRRHDGARLARGRLGLSGEAGRPVGAVGGGRAGGRDGGRSGGEAAAAGGDRAADGPAHGPRARGVRGGGTGVAQQADRGRPGYRAQDRKSVV